MLNKNANVIYMDSNEKHVGAVIVYSDAEKALWYDEEFTKEITNEELMDLFTKGLLLVQEYQYGTKLVMVSSGSLNEAGQQCLLSYGNTPYHASALPTESASE